ncbi:alpha/beta fold hydrolase [uncultured Roseibium sp.]|uniref:alpha/beta fold hydrolase n=1 Tax=uncultured Roseibium sp. TaxID=1936171 RepID=UPI003217B449
MSNVQRLDLGDGIVIETEVSGRGGAPWIVLSNGLGTTRDMWRPQLDLLEGAFRVLRYDTRGHGGSSTPIGPYSLDALVGDAIAVMDAHGVEKAIFMGLSMGGMTAMGLGLAHPDRLTKAICCAARADAPPPFVQSWIDRIAMIEKGGIGSIWEGTLARWLTAETQKAAPDLVAELKADFLRTTAEGYCGCAEALKKLDYLKDLPGLAVPILFVSGAEDMASPSAAMRHMADETPGSRYAEIPAVAHILNCDNPDAFNRVIAEFLGI